MNLYEHTIIARQDTSPSEIKQLTEKYTNIIEKNDGEIIKTENWGLLNLSYLINKNKKGSYIHFKIKGKGKMIDELEKNEAIDKKLLRYLTVRVKNFDLEYGSTSLEIQKNSKIRSENNLVIIDDLIATGGTAIACANLLNIDFKVPKKNIMILSVIDLPGLGGSKKAKEIGYKVYSLVSY